MAYTFLFMTIILALLCHTQGKIVSSGSTPAEIIAQAKNTAQKTITATQATIKVAKKYVKGIPVDPAQSCIGSLDHAINILNQYSELLKDFNPTKKGDVVNFVSMIVLDVDYCISVYNDKQPADLNSAIAYTYSFLRGLENITDKL